ncbi:MAG: hypothetical protein QXJ28_00395 [Candidatus Pacearchaeota archaeon]
MLKIGGEDGIMHNKKAQITLFVIIALVVLLAILIVFLFRDRIFGNIKQSEFSEVYNYFNDCIKEKTIEAIRIAQVQAGYIDLPDFEPGNSQFPFSSQLNFLGFSIPYWYYVSSNGKIKEQVPSKSLIESQLKNFLDRELLKCDFSSFREKGYAIKLEKVSSKVNIFDKKIDVIVMGDLFVSKENFSSVKSLHNVEVVTRFGEFYKAALDIYKKQKESMFLENYSIDVMYNYAPVTGVELSCSPLVWNPSQVANNLREALSNNILRLRVNNGKYYSEEKYRRYFTIKGLGVNNLDVSFAYSPNWPTRVEIWPVEDSLMIANPVGLENGMGILGFCYVPYHFVYDIYFPVLISVSDEEEFFLFPVSVIIDKSSPRNAIKSEEIGEEGSLYELCNYKNTNVKVFTYDSALNSPVEANLTYRCFNVNCHVGQTEINGEEAFTETKFPQCINGKLIAKANGYLTSEKIISTNEPITVYLPMDRIYELNLKILVGGRLLNEEEGIAVVNFEGMKSKFIAVYPQQRKINLAEDYYNLSVQVYSSSSLTIPSSSQRQCVKLPYGGIMGLFGMSRESCFEISLPEQQIERALTAGGRTSYYFTDDELKNSNELQIGVPSLPNPSSLDKLQQNYELANKYTLNINLNKIYGRV